MVLLDTNILLRRTNDQDPLQLMVSRAINGLIRDGEDCCTCSQCLIELWAVTTRPQAANGLGLSPADAFRTINTIRGLVTVIPDPPNLFNVWLDLCMSHEVRGRQVFDARIAAFMLATRVTRLLTFNGKDFSRFSGIQTLAPA